MGAQDSATIYQDIRIALETTANQALAATKHLQSLKIALSPKFDVSEFKASGSKYVNNSSTDAEWDEPSLSGQPSYTELPYVGAGAIQKVTAGTLVAGTTSVYDWLFSSNTYDQDDFPTFTIESGSKVRAEYVCGAIFKDLGFTFPRKGQIQTSGAMLASAMRDDKLRYLAIVGGTGTAGTFTMTVGGQTTAALAYNITAAALKTALEGLSTVGTGNVLCSDGPLHTKPIRIEFTGSFELSAIPIITVASTVTGATAQISRMYPSALVTELPQVTLSPKQISIYIAKTAAGLAGASRASRHFNYAWKIGNRNDAIWEFNDTIPSYADTIENEPSGEATLTVGTVDANMDILNSLRKNEPYFVRLQALGPVIETVGGTTYRHTLRIDQCLRFKGMSEKKANGAVVSRDFPGSFAHDSTWGKSFEMFVRTTTAAL